LTSTRLTLTESSTDLSDTDVAAYIQGGSTLTNGDSVNLLKNASGVTEAKSYTGTASEGVSVDYDITVARSSDGTGITLTLGDATEPEVDPEPEVEPSGASNNTVTVTDTTYTINDDSPVSHGGTVSGNVYGGKVPDTMDELLKLPGVGRKSANLIMGDVFGKPAIVTDTHCIRLVNRIGLVKGIKEPGKVEKELWKIVPPEEGNDFCHRLVDHGRAVCTARTKPYCDRCCLADICKKVMN